MNVRVLLASPGGGSLAYYSHQLAQGLAEIGCEIILLTTRSYELASFPSRFPVRPVLYEYTPWFGAYERYGKWRATYVRVASVVRTVQTYAAVLWTALRFRVSVCHFEWMMSRHDHLLYTLLKSAGISVVYTVHNVIPHEQDSAIGSKDDYSRLYHSASILIAHVEATRHRLMTQFRIAKDRIALIPHGSYPIFFQEPLHSQWRDHVRANEGEHRTILFFGMIRRYKGIEVLLDAFTILRSRGVGCKLLIVGCARGSYGSSVDFSRHPFSEDIELELRFVSLEEIPLYFLKADVVVLPYLRIDQSGVLLTAYTFGKPVVASDIGGFSEIVANGKTGLLVPPGDPDALADALAELLADEGRRERMGAYARHLAETEYAWTRIAAMTSRAYEEARRVRSG